MGVIYMKHEVHGAKVATMELEAIADEANGWVRYTLDTPVDEVAPVNVLEVKRRRKVDTEKA
jgi:hypothetical protein